MRRIVLFLALTVGLMVIYAHAALAAGFIEKDHYESFKTVIQANGYVCNTCEGGHVLGQGSRGMNFRVYCNENQNVYFVSWDFAGKQVCVEPWSRKGTRCEE